MMIIIIMIIIIIMVMMVMIIVSLVVNHDHDHDHMYDDVQQLTMRQGTNSATVMIERRFFSDDDCEAGRCGSDYEVPETLRRCVS